MKSVKKILIVCTGNSCRSIMAEGYLSKRLKDAGLGGVLVISSGTAASYGMRPTPEAIETMKEEGIDVSGYVSSSLSKLQIENADIILVMEPKHKETVIKIVPEAGKRTYLLKEFSAEKANGSDSIKDPIGMSLEFYKETFKKIKESIEGFIKWIEE